MGERFVEHRYYGVRQFMSTSNTALFANLEAISENLTKMVGEEIDKAMGYAQEMVEDVGGRIAEGTLVEVKPFSIQERAWVMIEITFVVDTQYFPVSVEGLELYEHQNLFLALAEDKIESMEIAPEFHGHRVTRITEKVSSGTVDYYLINVGGKLYVMTRKMISEMEGG